MQILKNKQIDFQCSKSVPIQNISFPKMKSKLKVKQIKLDKKVQHQSSLRLTQKTEGTDFLRKSFSLMNYKKSSKIMGVINRNEMNPQRLISPERDNKFLYSSNKKLSLHPFILSSKDISNHQSKQKYAFSSRCHTFYKQQNSCENIFTKQSLRKFQFKNQAFTNNMNKVQKDIKQNEDSYQKCQLNQRSFSTKFNNKKQNILSRRILTFKKQKQEQSPYQLITRKLLWDGKQSKKVNHLSIHKQIIGKISSEKIAKCLEEDKLYKTKSNKLYDFKVIEGWADADFKEGNKFQVEYF